MQHLTDLGNARRLVTRHGHDLRYCPAWRSWLVWDGNRWDVDKTGEVMRRAKETVQAIYAEAAHIADEETRREVAKWAMKSESRSCLLAMIDLAKTEPGIPAVPDELDADPWLLNVQNGTLDLKTGELLPPCRTDLITKRVPVIYDPAAKCPTWEAFLNRVLPDPTLNAFIQRVLGYALTGDISEQVLFIACGSGANGKSTLFNTFRAVLGPDYAQHTPTETLLVKARSGGIPNDLARLKGARFVSAMEADAERRLDEVRVKQLTGGDPITARYLYGEYFEFTPMFKLFVAANHKPLIRGTDHAIWRRIVLIHFTVSIPAAVQDKNLPYKLEQERAGILAWCVRGCLAWQSHGLSVPEEVIQATAAYREEMDVFGTYLKDRCLVHPRVQVTTQALYADYQAWCHQNGDHPISKRSFGLRLQEQGFTSIRIGAIGTRGWRGLRLQPETDTPDTTDTSLAGRQNYLTSRTLRNSVSHVNSVGFTHEGGEIPG